AASPGQEAALLQPLEQRGEGAVVELEPGDEVAHGAVALFPEDGEHEVLRVRHAQRLEQRAVHGGDRACGGLEVEAHHLVERYGAALLLGHGFHATTRYACAIDSCTR